MKGLVRDAIRELALQTPLGRYLGHRYSYMFTPAQLCFLVECIDKTAALPGPILEIGCAAGVTTVWLNKHMDDARIEKSYIALDTFKGFLARDIEYEVSMRGKGTRQADLKRVFASNKRRWVEKTLQRNSVTRVTLIEADASTFDYSAYSDISFALIDVDLYLPVKNSLAKLYPRMAAGGMIVVDDCSGPGIWDGALQAYLEFMESKGLSRRIMHGKLGVIACA
jgi:O-methyltransferase